jgi:hypothetical protein
VRPYPTLRDEALRTQSDCDYAVRSLATLHGKCGHYINDEIVFVPNVFPGDFIAFQGLTIELTQIDSGSIAWGEANPDDEPGKYSGKMSFCGRVG